MTGIDSDRLVGIIPAAGKGTRIAPLPNSKELFPIGFGEMTIDGSPRRYPKAVSQYIIENMIQAGVQHIYLIISDGKWDILKYYGDGQRLGAYFSYLMVEKMHGMPYTINMAYPWIQGATVVFGMPDTIFSPGDAYQQLLAKHKKSNADLTLGLFETSQPWRFGMVDFDRDGKVLACIDKPVQTNLCYLWGNACWGPRFSEFLNEKLNLLLSGPSPRVELVLGDFFQMAVTEGMNVQSIPFTDGSYIDIGSPEELEKTIRQYIGS